MKPLLASLAFALLATTAHAEPLPEAKIDNGDTFICTWFDPERAHETGTHGTIIFTIADPADRKVHITKTTDGRMTIENFDGQILRSGERTISFVATQTPSETGFNEEDESKLHAISIGTPSKTALLNAVRSDASAYELIYIVISTVIAEELRMSNYWVYTGTCART